uniref:G-protein coupled receptors family 1 profile domain-containing protein n=1 Tax=Panagrolaimus superbus TaxID=310955 RepID=A0A914Y0T1_9BILA
MDFNPSNSTDSLLSITKDVLLNFTIGADLDLASAIGFENTTTILLHVSGGNNDSITEFLRNLTMVNETMTNTHHFRKNVSNGVRMLIKISNYAGYVYMLLALLGVILNAGVLIRLAQLAYTDYERFKTGCGLPLAAMSAADLTSLMSIIVTVMSSAFIPPNFFPLWARSLQCKVTMFLIHAMTGFSTWCWLFVSALRYMAVYHPLWHISRWQLGHGSLILMLLFILISNSWLLLSVIGFPHTCGEVPLTNIFDLNRVIHAFEMFVSYILPAILTFALDIRVLITRPPQFHVVNSTLSIEKQQFSNRTSGEKSNGQCKNFLCLRFYVSLSEEAGVTHENYQKHVKVPTQPKKRATQMHRARSAVLRWLMITTIDLLLNAPDNFLRIASIISQPNHRRESSPGYHFIALVARLLYFAQFCFNAFYLSTIVYKRNVESSKSRQQRLRHQREVVCRQCGLMHDGRCENGVVLRSHIRRRYSAEPGLHRSHAHESTRLVESKSHCLTLNLPELARAPSLPLVNEKMHLFNTKKSNSDIEKTF